MEPSIENTDQAIMDVSRTKEKLGKSVIEKPTTPLIVDDEDGEPANESRDDGGEQLLHLVFSASDLNNPTHRKNSKFEAIAFPKDLDFQAIGLESSDDESMSPEDLLHASRATDDVFRASRTSTSTETSNLKPRLNQTGCLESFSEHQSSTTRSLQELHIELLKTDQRRLTQQAASLQRQLEDLQKRNAQERSKLLMKQRQMAVQVEMLQEDKAFLLAKYDRLGRKLLSLHRKRIERLESESSNMSSSS